MFRSPSHCDKRRLTQQQHSPSVCCGDVMDSHDVLDVELYDSDVIFNQTERLLVFGSSNSGKSKLVENLVRKYSHSFIGLFCVVIRTLSWNFLKPEVSLNYITVIVQKMLFTIHSWILTNMN